MDRECRNCKHWSSPWDEFASESLGEHLYDVDRPVYDEWKASGDRYQVPESLQVIWGHCRLITHPSREENRSARAFTYDGSGYNSGLNVRADFGCVEWEETRDEPGRDRIT